MAITADQFAESLNKAGIDTPAKADNFALTAALQMKRVALQMQLAGLAQEAEAFGTDQSVRRAKISADISAAETAIIQAVLG